MKEHAKGLSMGFEGYWGLMIVGAEPRSLWSLDRPPGKASGLEHSSKIQGQGLR